MSLALFVLFTAVLGALITIFLFFSSRLLGFVVSKLLSTFWLGTEGFIYIGTMNISVLTGRILLGNVVYSTQNTCVRIVDCIITIRWWMKDVRESTVINADKDTRLSVSLEGLEYMIFNNTFKYDHLEEILRKREGDHWAAEVVAPANLVPVHQFIMPMFYRLFPATSISIKRGCLMVGNPELPTMLVVAYRKGSGLHTTDEPRFQYDYYKQVTTMELINLNARIVSNPDYSGEEEVVVDRPINSEDFVSYAFESFKSFFKDIRFAFINPDDDDAFVSELNRRSRLFSYGGSTTSSNHSTPDHKIRHPSQLPQHPPQQQHDHSKFETILQSGYVNMTYHCDVQGPVPMAADHQPFNSLTAPQWGVDIVCNAATIVYGPWANRQRDSLQKFFFPPDYEEMKIHVPVAGQPRQYSSFNLNVTFNRDTTFRIPFRELSKDMHIAPSDRKPAWLEIQMNNISTIHYVAPMVVTRNTGYTVTIDAILTGCSISTSLTNTPFLTCASFALNCSIHYPLMWNNLNEWKCKLAMSDPKCFFLWDHVSLLNDLGADWSAGEPVQLADFVPCRYTISLSLANFSLYCNVNELNIIDKPNDLNENAHYAFTGPSLECTVILPYINFQSPKNEISFDFQVSRLALKLILPEHNTIRQHLEDFHSDEYDGDSGDNNSSQFLFFDTLGLNGKYLYYSKYDPTYLDSIVLQLKGKSVTISLFGFFIRYFLSLKSNYFGYCSKHITREQYKAQAHRRKHTNSIGGLEDRHSVGQSEAKNGFEIYVVFELDEVTALLPLHLYSSQQQATITCSAARLEVRYLPIYLDLLVNFSPMVVRVPSPSKDFDSGRDPLQIKDCNFHLHFMYGPPPSVTNYAEQYFVEIREVSGHVVLTQITALTAWFSNFFFHLSNKDNDISEDLAAYSLPIYTTVLVRVHELGLHLWTPSYNSVTQVRLPSGFHLSSHTLISPVAHSTTTVRIPSLAIHILVPTRDNSGRSMWVETGTVQLALLVNIFSKAPHGHDDASFQWLFLRQNDELTKRLAFLWPPTSHSKYKAYIKEALTHSDSVYNPVLALAISNENNVNANSNKRASLSAADHLADETGKLEDATGDAVLHSPNDAHISPVSRRRREAIGSSLLRASKTPSLISSGTHSDVPSVKSPSGRAPSITLDSGLYATDTEITETDRSEMDNDNFYSAESSIASDSEDDDDDEENDEGSMTDNDELYSSVKDVPAFLGKQRIQSDLRKSGDHVVDGSNSLAGGNSSKDAFERAKKANMFGNELDNEIHSLHHYLKHFIISRGSKSDSPSATVPSEKITFTEYQPYQGGRVSFPGCSHKHAPPLRTAGQTPPVTPPSDVPQRNDDDEHSEDAATTIFCIDTMNDIEVFATPVVVSIVEELIDCLIAKSPSVNSLLDNFQLKTISEKFTVKKYLHNRSILEITSHNVHFRFIQAAQSVPNDRIYMSEVSLERVQVQLAMCYRRSFEHGEGVPPASPRGGSFASSPSFPSGMMARSGVIGYQLPEEELCSFESSLVLGPVHACSQILNNLSFPDQYSQVPSHLLLTPHESGSHVLVSFNTNHIKIEAAYTDGRKGRQTSSFTGHIGAIDIKMILDSPLIIFQIAEGWVLHIKDLLRVVSNYQELWARQLQCLVSEILRANAKPIAQRAYTKADDPKYRGILDPSFAEFIGEHAILHRSGWQEISRMRHYMKAVGSPAYLDEMLKHMMDNRHQNYSSFEAFQQLINDVYESDQRENMVDLFQSSLIKKVFIEPPRKNSNIKIDVRLVSDGVSICFFGNPSQQDNKCIIGQSLLAGTASYQYSTAFSPVNTAASGSSRNVPADRVALSARHPVPRVTLDATVSAECASLSLELAPSILLLGSSLTRVLIPAKPAPVSPNLSSRSSMVSPGTWQTSIMPTAKSVDMRTGHSMAEWKMVSTPELGKLRPTAHTKIKIRDTGLERSGSSEKVSVRTGEDKVKSRMIITIHANACVHEISLKGSSAHNGGAQVLLKNTCLVFQKMNPEKVDIAQATHSALLRLSTIQLFFFNPNAKKKEDQTLGKIRVTDFILHHVAYAQSTGSGMKHMIRTLSNMSSSSNNSKHSATGYTSKGKGGREELHDVLVHFTSATLPFNTYDKMLPKLLGFLDEWNPIELLPNKNPIDSQFKSENRNSGLIPANIIGVQVKLDLRNVVLSTDILHSLPFKYTIERISATFTPNTRVSLDNSSSKEIAFDLRIWHHELEIEKVQLGPLPPKLVFPQITSHGSICESGDKISIACGLEIDVIKHTINVDMLNTIMVLQKTIEEELKQLANAFSGYAEKRKDKQDKVTKPSTALSNLQLTFTFDLALRGFDIRALSPLAVLQLTSDMIDCKLQGSYIKMIPSTPPPLRLSSTISPVTSGSLVMNWNVRVRKISMYLTDAPGQVWASITTNVEIQTTPEPGERAERSKLKAPKRPIPWVGVLVESTGITLQAGAIECAAGLFVHYLDSIEKGKITIRDALGSSSQKTQPDELAFLIRVIDTTISVPLVISSSSPNSSSDANASFSNTTEPNLVVALESFVLSGEVTNVLDPNSKPALSTPSSASCPQRLLGSSHFSSLQLRFRDGYTPLSKGSTQTNTEAYQENWAMISKGTCALAGHIAGPSVVMSGELLTSGMQANITNEIIKYSNFLTHFLALSQEKLKNLNSTVPQHTTQSPPSLATPRTLELDFSFNIQTGSCRLSRAWLNGNPPLIQLDPSSTSSVPNKQRPDLPPPSTGFGGSPFQSPQIPRAPPPSHESFPLPPLVVSIHHTFTLAEGKGTEDSSVGITIDSAKLRFSPFLAIFIEESLYCSTLYRPAPYIPSQPVQTTFETAQPPASSGRGTVTVAIKVNPTTVVLEGGGITEIVCTLELGSVELFLSSVHKAVSPKGNTVLLNNAVVNIHSLALKVHHPMSSDENAGLFVSNIGFNIGQAYGLRVDNGRVVCALLDGQICSAYFNMRHLDDFLVFVWTWTRTYIHRPTVPVETEPSATSVLVASKSTSPADRISLFVNAHITSLMLDVDLTPISRINAHIDNVVAGLCPGSGSMEDSSRIGSFAMTFLTGPAEVAFNGKLEGVAKISSAALMGERRQKPSRKKRTQPTLPIGNAPKIVTMWAAQLSSPHVSLEYNLGHILLLKAGDFYVKLIDHLLSAQLTEEPIPADKKGQLPPQDDVPLSYGVIGPLSCELISQKLHLQLSCETITSILDVVRRVTVTLKEKVAVAKSVFDTQSDSDIVVTPAEAKVPEQKKSSAGVVVGQMRVKGFDIKVWFFGYSIRDPAWASFTLESYQISLDKQVKRSIEIHRQLSIVLGQNHVSKMTENEFQSRDPWHRPATETKIFRIPVASLIMYTMQKLASREVEFYFLTEFTDSIWVSLNIGLYGYLREIATLYSRAAEDEGREQPSEKPTPASGPVSSASSHSTSSLPTVSLPKRSHLSASSPVRPDSRNESRVFIEKTFQLSPTLNVLGDFTPKITTVFGWLGIKDINHTIPYYTHLGLTDHLEEILANLLLFYEYQQGNNYNNNNNNNVN